MQAPPFLSADDLAALVPMRDAIEAIRDAYRVRERPVERTQVPVAGGDLLVMPAVDGGAAGVKVVMVQPANRARGGPVIQGVYVLIDGASGAPVALLDGGALTRLRTPAASAVATDVLARHDSCSLGVVGTGPQAHGHVTAILVARPGLVDVRIAARTASAAHELVDRLRTAGVAARAVGIDVAAAADIVCTCTSSPTPLFSSAAICA